MLTDKHKLILGLLITGACVMILELLVTRLVAPYYGSSIFVWTAMIGVVLAFLAYGYHYGGQRSSVHASFRSLSVLLIAVVVWLIIITLAKEPILIFTTLFPDPRLGVVLTATIILGLPAFLLGMVSPFAVQLVVTQTKSAGAEVGNLYAISTLGSILGTFLAGFYLIPELGHIQALYVTAIALLLVAWLWYPPFIRFIAPLLVLCLVGAYLQIGTTRAANLVLDTDTPYVRAQVYHKDGTSSLYLNGAHSSAHYLDDPTRLALDYYHYYDLANHFQATDKALMIGGAGLGYPRYFALTNPDSYITVVEIDDKLTDIATNHLGYTSLPNIDIVHTDGRLYLKDTQEKYHAILFDAFSAYTVPPQLVTIEAARLMKQALDPTGVIVMNMIGTRTGPKSEIVRGIITTFSQVFSHVSVLATKSDSPSLPQNFILIASDFHQTDSLPDSLVLGGRDTTLIPVTFAPGAIFTDNWAPTEKLSFEIVN
jgi:spermidine synthase